MIFCTKMDSKFTRKARLVAGVHNTSLLLSITYSSVVTRENVRLKFLIDGLNDLDICACNIANAYPNAPYQEKYGSKKDQNLGVRKDTFSLL